MRSDLTAIILRVLTALLTLTFAFAGFAERPGDKDGISTRHHAAIAVDLTPSGAAPPIPGASFVWHIAEPGFVETQASTPLVRSHRYTARTIFRDAPKRPPPACCSG